MSDVKRLAVIGLGSMGGAMAQTLHRLGWNVVGVDPSPEARTRAAQFGIATAGSAQEVAGTAYVVLSLPSAAMVERTVPAVLSQPGTIAIVDTTTSEPATSQAMADQSAAAGTAFVDAPVSGGRAGALAGTLSAFVGGTAESVAAAEPVLHALTGKPTAALGGPGSGNVVKLLNNVLCAVNLVAVGEALDIAAAYGIDLATAAAAVSRASGGSNVSANAYPDWVLSGTYSSGFSLGLMARDVDLALQVGADRGAKPTVLAQAQIAWQRALAERGPAADFTEIAPTTTTASDAFTATAHPAAPPADNPGEPS